MIDITQNLFQLTINLPTSHDIIPKHDIGNTFSNILEINQGT